MKKWFNFSNVSTIFMVLVILALIFVPAFKSTLIQGLMKVGLFQPDVSQNKDKKAIAPKEHAIFRDVQGNTMDVVNLQGKVVFLNFWASWCPPCLAEMPSLETLYQKYKADQDIVFLFVDADGNIEAASAFMKKKNYHLPVFVPNSEIPAVYFSGSLPTTLIFDRQGNIAFQHEGAADYANPKIAALIDSLKRL